MSLKRPPASPRSSAFARLALTRKTLAPLITGIFLFHQTLQAATNPAALPTGGTFTAGTGIINAFENILTVNQSSVRGIIDWSTFSIGQGGLVTFRNGTGATLNRVTGNQMSSIMGSLNASGSVYLINPEGILIGHGARINTGGDFLASTLPLSSSDFLAGNSLLLVGSSKNAVVNLGSIFSNNGSVFLIGHQIRNSGSVTAKNGTVGLAAGSEVLLKDSTGDQRVFVRSAGSSVTNEGVIAAAQVELKAKGGNIYALAGNNGGIISATGSALINGHVWLISDGGDTRVTGSVVAKNANGKLGSIETSGAHLDISHASIKTGQGGNWLLDPVDLTVDSAAAATIQSSLATTNVSLQTSANSASGPGSQASGSGDIHLNSPVSWSANTTLTLDAYHGVDVNAAVTSTGASGGLAVLTNHGGSGGFFTVNAPISLASGGTLNINASAYSLVNTLSDLQNLPGSGSYALNANLDLSSVPNFTPLGNFSGTFEGLGHTIGNLTQSGAIQYMGLFSGLLANSSVENLALTNVNETSPTSNAVTMGSLAAVSQASIYNTSASGQFHVGQGALIVGGLIGQQTGSAAIQNSHAAVSVDATLAGSAIAGGLVGSIASGGLQNSYASGAVSCGDQCQAGGLAGTTTGPTTNSYANGSVTGGRASQVGGLMAVSSAPITNSYATGNVTAGDGDTGILQPSFAGGLAAITNAGGTVTGSYATGTVQAGTFVIVGGLLGRSQAAVDHSYATGNVTIIDNGSAGGLIGQNKALLTDSYATGAIMGGTNVLGGGLVARGFSTGPIANSYANGSVTVGDYSAAGGFVAWNQASVTQSFATGAVSAGNSSNAGGFVATVLAPITNSYATGSVSASGDYSLAGGFAGENDVSIANSYARGSVNGGPGINSSTGGLAGYVDTTASVATSYSTGAVVGAAGSLVGGLVGQNAGSANITDSFWDTTTSGQLASQGGTGYTTRQWLTSGPFITSAANWDFANTWVGGYPYPVLKAFPYVLATLGGNLTYGTFTGSGFNVTGAVNQNGQNAAQLISGTVTAITASPRPPVGSYVVVGGSGQTAAPNYQLTYLGTYNVTPATLTQSIGAANKTYDGTAGATGQIGSLSGVLSGDQVAVDSANVLYSFSDKNAGQNKTVTATQLTLTGAESSNYVLAPSLTTASITPALLTELFTAGNKVYDGTTTASISSSSLSGLISGDSVSVGGGVYNFSDKNAANGKTVTGSGATLTGVDAQNYTLALVQNGTAAISPAQLLYVAGGGSGTLTRGFGVANPALTGTVSGLVGGDTLASVTSGSAVFSSPATFSSVIGQYAVNGSGLSLTGPNYTLGQGAQNADALTVQPISIGIGSVIRASGSPNPTFTAIYTGPRSDYLNSLLANLVLVSNAPASDAPGTYQITAAVPPGLASSIVVAPGTLTIVAGNILSVSNNQPFMQASVPASLQSQFFEPAPPLPSSGGNSVAEQLIPGNAVSHFQVVITPSQDWSPVSPLVTGTANAALSQASFADSPPDGRGNGNKSTYAAGAQK